MSISIVLNFDKYWCVICGMMIIGIALDPRYKIELMGYFFTKIYKDKFDCEFEKMNFICKDW